LAALGKIRAESPLHWQVLRQPFQTRPISGLGGNCSIT
jgi:hypothetical protein